MLTLLAIDNAVTPITQGITFAIVGGFFTVVTLIITNRSKKASETAEDKRQIAKEERDYARLDEVQRRAELTSAATLSKLNNVEQLGIVTHALVNSDKTAAMNDRLDDKIAQLALMREIVSLKEDAGRKPTAETLTAINTITATIETLRANIHDRVAQQHAAERQNATAPSATHVEGLDPALGVVEALQVRVDTLEETTSTPLPPPPPK